MVKKYFTLKKMDIIEMANNVLQVRHLGRIFLLNMESEEYKTKFYRLLKLMENKKELSDIVKDVKLPEKEIHNIIDQLNICQLIEVSDSSQTTSVPENYISTFSDYFQVFDLAPLYKSKSESIQSIYSTNVSLIGTNPLAQEILAKLLEFGFRILTVVNLDGKKETKARIEAFCTQHSNYDDYTLTVIDVTDISEIDFNLLGEYTIVPFVGMNNEDFFKEVNKHFIEKNKNWIPIHVEETMGCIGPTVIPYKTACFECTTLRLISNIENIDAYKAYITYTAENKKDFPQIQSNYQLVAINFLIEFYKIISGYKYGSTYNGIIEVSFHENKCTNNSVLKFPKCPMCGSVKKEIPFYNYAYSFLASRY